MGAIWDELLRRLGLWVIPLMVLTWLARGYLERHWKRDEAKLSALAEQRAAKIQLLYGSLVKTERLLTDLYYLHMPVGPNPPAVDLAEASTAVRALRDLATEQRPFYPPGTAKLIDSICESLERTTTCLQSREWTFQYGGGGSDGDAARVEQEAFTTLKYEIPRLKESLESEFRHILAAHS